MRPGGAPYGLIEDGAIALEEGWIAYAGAAAELPERFNEWPQESGEGNLITPALIDCHTHIVFGGDRAKEFEARLEGASYEEIARAGGGILSTVKATREVDEDALLESALVRVDALLAEGVATLEIKSGYGLDSDTERKMLRVARAVEKARDISVVTSFLGAHAIPPDYKGRGRDYLVEVAIPALRLAADDGLVDAVDGFCEGIAFSADEIALVFDAADELGLAKKLHAEQLSDLSGAKLAADRGALSADHLEYLSKESAAAMAAVGTVAVLLPGAFYTLREAKLPPVDILRAEGVPMAVATDCNPGSSPLTSILLAMNMAATLFRLTPEEALAGVTRNAARALGLSDRGMLAEGTRADLAEWAVETPAELSYRIGFNPLVRRIVAGEDV
ncbi:MAG: imidazolonepropionase [Pseudomonadota bacterium]